MDVEVTDNLALTSEFSVALKEELDRVGFPPAPERVIQLMQLFGLSKPQVYRITSGKAAPTLSSLMQLRTLGISIDDILDRLKGSSDHSPAPQGKTRIDCQIEVSGVAIPCSLTVVPASTHSGLVAVKSNDHVWRVIPVKPGTELPEGAIPVSEIRFTDSRPAIAIVDDHPGTLTVLCKQLDPYFRSEPFSEGSALLKSSVSRFSGFILDWRLPDISGIDLVMSLRRMTSAPIIVITGETGENSSRLDIARAIAENDVHYVVKPVDEVILAAQMTKAIAMHIQR